MQKKKKFLQNPQVNILFFQRISIPNIHIVLKPLFCGIVLGCFEIAVACFFLKNRVSSSCFSTQTAPTKVENKEHKEKEIFIACNSFIRLHRFK
jgi:hypothetical protein